MNDLIGFEPAGGVETFQGKPVDSKTGLIGFEPYAPGSYDEQLSQIVPPQARDEVARIQGENDAISQKLEAETPGAFKRWWNNFNTPLLNPSKTLTLGKQLDFMAGKPYTPTEDDWDTWVNGKLVNINRERFPNGQQPGVDWWRQDNAPVEVLKSLRHEFETKFLGVPQGGRAPEDQSESLKMVGGVVKGVEAVAGGAADFLTSPAGISTLGLGAAPRLVQKAVGTYFMGHMASQYPDLWKRAQEAAAKGDDAGLAQIGTETALNTMFIGLLGAGVMSKEPKNKQTGLATDPASNAKVRFEQRPGETKEQFFQRFKDFQEQLEAWNLANEQQQTKQAKPADQAEASRRQIEPDFIDAEFFNEGRALPPTQAGPLQIADGPGPIITPSPLENAAARFRSNRQAARDLLRLSVLQDNPVLLEAGEIISAERPGLRSTENVKPVMLDVKVDEVPPSPLPDYPPARPPARPDEGVVDPNAPKPDLTAEWPKSKDPLSKALEAALRNVLKVPEEPANAPLSSPSPEIKTPVIESQRPSAPVKPWEIRQQLQERSQSKPQPVSEYVETPDNHPVIRFWSEPDSYNYALTKANAAFPNDSRLATEVAQDAHTNLYLNASKASANTPNAKAWAMRSISNYVIDRARKIKRDAQRLEQPTEESSPLDAIPDDSTPPDVAVGMKELEDSLSKAKQSMSSAELEVYQAMRGDSSVTFAELARKQGVSPMTMTRIASELRGRIAKQMVKDGIDISDYDAVSEFLAKTEPAKGKGIKPKLGSPEAGFTTIIPHLTRIIAGWMKSGASAARAIGHAIKVFGRRIAAPAARIATRLGYNNSRALMGFRRPMRPIQPWIPGQRSTLSVATARHPGWIRRPAEWSALDVVNKAGLTELGQRMESYHDRMPELEGRWTTPLAVIEQSHSNKEIAAAAKEWENHFLARESRNNGATPQQSRAVAAAGLVGMSRAARDMINWQRQVVMEMADISRTLGVQVKDGNQWRLGNFNNEHYPRIPAPWIRELSKDPNSKKNRPLLDRAVNEMLANGNATSRAEAEAFFSRDGWGEHFNDGQLSTTEKARGEKLPDSFYDYSLDGFVGYVSRTADRLAQIEAFGQSLGGTQDTAFEVARSKTTNSRLVSQINDLRHHYYRDNRTPDALSPLMQKLDAATTIGYLGFSTLGAARNVATAMGMSMTSNGVTPTVVAAAKTMFAELEAVAKSSINLLSGEPKSERSTESLVAQEIGAITRDMRYASMREHMEGTWMDKAVNAALVFNTFGERVGRMIEDTAVTTWLRHTVDIHNQKPGSLDDRTRKARLSRVGFVGQKLTDLMNGDPLAVQEFERAAVSSNQFSYRANQSSTMFDKGWARFFLKFQKFGAMASRWFDREVMKPLAQKHNGQWSPDIWPLVRAMGIAFPLVGELYQEAKEKLFNRPRKTASIEEIVNTADEDVVRALGLIANRYFIDITWGGALGIIGDYAGTINDFANRGRFKSPLEAPGITAVQQFATLLLHRWQRGLTTEGILSDVGDLAKSFPATAQVTGVSQQAVRQLGSGSEKALLDARRVQSEARPLLERFSKEKGYWRGSKFNSTIVSYDENTAEMSAFKDAMMAGDKKLAVEIYKDFVGNSKDKLRAQNILKGTANTANPLYSKNAGIDTEEKVAEFLKWVEKRVPSKLSSFRKAYIQYESANPAGAGSKKR